MSGLEADNLVAKAKLEHDYAQIRTLDLNFEEARLENGDIV
jgi:hypothetical protein